MSGSRRIDQDMAKAATQILPPAITADLRTRYRQLPMMVRMSGLAATVAYLVSKSGRQSELEKAYTAVVDGIRARLQEQRYFPEGSPVRTNEALVGRLAELPSSEYARASAEVEALATWLSRLAEARFKAQSCPVESR